jgi:coproporphyrinogen III oxidase-like Fe-S oxidoreductase
LALALPRPRTTRQYDEWVQTHGCPPKATEALDKTDLLLETLMLGLRLAEGLNLTHLSQQFGDAIIAPILASLAPYEQRGWVKVTLASSSDLVTPAVWVKFTDPEGFLFSNVMLAALFADLINKEEEQGILES